MSPPYQTDLLAIQCPDTTVILAHIGGFFSGEAALTVAQQRANVLVDTSEVPFPDMLRKAVERLGAEKVLFGRDGPGIDIRLETMKVKLSSQQEWLVMCDSFARLMGVSVESGHAYR
jgi:predicted TIM-barrel fold metal-dependent hydrolase